MFRMLCEVYGDRILQSLELPNDGRTVAPVAELGPDKTVAIGLCLQHPVIARRGCFPVQILSRDSSRLRFPGNAAVRIGKGRCEVIPLPPEISVPVDLRPGLCRPHADLSAVYDLIIKGILCHPLFLRFIN